MLNENEITTKRTCDPRRKAREKVRHILFSLLFTYENANTK